MRLKRVCRPERSEGRALRDIIALLLVLCLTFTAGAQPAPYHRYRTLDTPHFHVHVPEGLEREGRVAGAAAEHAYALLAKELAEPRGPIDLVVTDDADYSNGYATTVPTNRIVVFATPPVDASSLRLNEDWLGIVITHELTHIFHLDRARGIWSVAQHVFGRAPELFPNQYGPSWLTEGLAVYYESRLTAGGRLKDVENRMLARAAALEHRLPQLNALSLSSPLFPGGAASYGYGALFVDYLASTRGDSTIRRFVDVQSASLIPFRLNHQAESAFGISFQSAFSAFRDSIQGSVGELRPPLPGWRELTTHGYYALDPRWLSDSTLVYTANDGRSTSAEYELTLTGDRRRLGRRNSLGRSVPLPGGGLLFAQVELTSSYEVRSDLFVERNGRQRQLTHGLRLVQPDARRDGTIVAVQLAPGRASLLLLDAAGRERRALRVAEPDETWSEPRWSPDGSAIVVSHRTHGGTFSLEVLDVATGAARVLDRGAFLISSPSWTPDGETVLYTTAESGTPELAGISANGRSAHTVVPCRPERSEESARAPAKGGASYCGDAGVYAADVAPNGRIMAAVTLRADGYHVGVAPVIARDTALTAHAVLRLSAAAPIDTQPLAPGAYHAYSAWRSVLPRYWYPVVEAAPGRGTRLGATTSGHDIVYRHLYDAGVTIPTTGSYPTANINYRFAGLRRPFIDLFVAQDYTLERTLANGGTTQIVGSLLRRVQFGSLATTFTRPRVRTYSALSLGGAVEHRSFVTDPGEFFKQINDTLFTRDFVFPSAFIGAQWSNLQRPGLSISAEDGVSLAITARARSQSDIARRSLSTSVVGTAATVPLAATVYASTRLSAAFVKLTYSFVPSGESAMPFG